jgi:hypothetical protein
MKIVAFAFRSFIFSLFIAAVMALATPPARAETVAITSEFGGRVTSALTGRWLGALEYRDYKSDARVSLPTLLEVNAGSNGSLDLAYTYDDGNGKIVREHQVARIDSVAATYVITNEDKSSHLYRIASASPFDASGKTQLVLVGHGTDNDRPAAVRETLTITPKAMTMLRETRVTGGEFLFRHRFTFSRLQ